MTSKNHFFDLLIFYLINFFLFSFLRSEYLFKFEDKFEIHDDVEVLKRMGLLLGL